MSFFQKLFGKENTPENETPEQLLELADLLGVPVTPLPSSEPEACWESYQQAVLRGRQEGFTPIVLLMDDLLLETMELNEIIESPQTYDGKAWLEQKYAEIVEWAGEENMPFDPPQQETAGMHRFISMTMNQDAKAVLAEIPTQNPWEVIRWIPFGGWNECPMPEDMMQVLEYWYKKYGATVGCISHDTMELAVPNPVTESDAPELAKEQYAFCTDIVNQGVGSIPALAEDLKQSTVWFFWWD